MTNDASDDVIQAFHEGVADNSEWMLHARLQLVLGLPARNMASRALPFAASSCSLDLLVTCAGVLRSLCLDEAGCQGCC